MAKRQNNTNGADGAKKGRRKKIVGMLAATAVVGLGAKMTVLKPPPPPDCPVTPPAVGHLAEPPSAASPTPHVTNPEAAANPRDCKPPVPGATMLLEPITLNLVDGHYLKVGIALQLSDREDPKHLLEAGEGAKALDAAIQFFGSKRYDQLIDPEQRSEAKASLTKSIIHDYEGKVLNVYFTEFVMQ
jgi:flagellar FliL protein